MNRHHLILGEIRDVISGETVPDTHDERYRQKLARLLIGNLGYEKRDIEFRDDLKVTVDEKCAILKLDFKIRLRGRIAMMIKYGPGSLVTRHRPAIAASRLAAPYQIPVVVVTNGEDADILDGISGQILAHGLTSIPTKTALREKMMRDQRVPISEEQARMEARILYAFEVDDSCPCDDDICVL